MKTPIKDLIYLKLRSFVAENRVRPRHLFISRKNYVNLIADVNHVQDPWNGIDLFGVKVRSSIELSDEEFYFVIDN